MYSVGKKRFRSILSAERHAEALATKRGKACSIVNLKTGQEVVAIAPRYYFVAFAPKTHYRTFGDAVKAAKRIVKRKPVRIYDSACGVVAIVTPSMKACA
jgi:hypothetical protein